MLSLLYLSPVSSHHCILGWTVWYLRTEHGMRRCGERRLCPWWSSMASHPPHHRVHRPGGMAPCRSSWAHTQVWPLWNILLANPCFHAYLQPHCPLLGVAFGHPTAAVDTARLGTVTSAGVSSWPRIRVNSLVPLRSCAFLAIEVTPLSPRPHW